MVTSPTEGQWSSGRTFDGEFESRKTRIELIDLEYTDWNPKAEKTVLLLHGLSVQGHTWDPIASVLAERYRVLVPDLRGHGGSSWATDGYWTKLFVVDLVGLVSNLDIDSYAIVGHSLGARVGLALAVTDSSRALSLVMSDNGPELKRTGAQEAAKRAMARISRHGFRTREEATAAYQEQHPEWRSVFHELHARYQLRENWAGMFVERADPDLYWLTREPGRRDEPYLWNCCRTVRCPVLMMWGAESEHIDAGIVARMAGVIANFRSIKMPSGHYIPREVPDEFCHELLAFLESQD